MFRIIIGIFLLSPSISSNELKDLTENFFENLEIHLKAGVPIDESIVFADKQVENFVDLIRHRQRVDGQEKRIKRQVVETADDGNYGVRILNGLTPSHIIPSRGPKDLQLFQHSDNFTKTWYAAALQGANKLKIFKYNGHEFHSLHQREVHSAVRLALFTTPTRGTFVVVAENRTKANFHEKTSVYRFAANENLEKVQNLHVDYATDVAIWSDKGDIFMAIVQQFNEDEATKELSCNARSTIYKWLGGHFDVIQHLNTSCAVRVTQFAIGKSRFIAIANQGGDGTSDAFSEIFKYDLDLEKFASYQKIATRGASDVKFFAFRNANGLEKRQESYIVVANTFSKEENGAVDFNIKSIVYKYVEGYFLPFQSFDLPGVTHWLPVIGSQSEFVLMAVSKFEGLRTYQYNGWKFQPTPDQFAQMSSLSAGIQSLHAYNFEGTDVIVVSNPQNEEDNMFQLHFALENPVDRKYNSLLTWCRSTLNEQSQPALSQKAKRQTNVKGLRSVEEDLSNDKNQENNLAFLELQLENQAQQLALIENKIDGGHPLGKDIVIIPGDLFVSDLTMKDEVLFNELIAETLNDVNVVAFLTGLVPIDIANEKAIPRLELEAGTIETLVTAGLKSVNGHPTEDLLHKSVDNLLVTDLVINGNFWVTDLQVKGRLNGMQFNSTNVLLREGDQFFLGNLSTRSVAADNVTARFLNKLNLHTQPQAASVKISSVDTLRVKRLTVGGYMNDVDLPTLDKYALKTTGGQTITGDYFFNELVLRDLQAARLNNFIMPDDLVRVSEGEYFVHQDVQMDHDLQAVNLVVTDSLNNILVLENEELDVLKKNASQMQFVDGTKTIQEVELLKPMRLQGKINSESMQELNPVTKLSEPLDLYGDYVMTGKVTIEETLAANDLVTESHSLLDLQQNGLKLTEDEIHVHIDFTQQLNTYEIFADKINGIDTHQWVVNGHEEPQYVQGWKSFEGDLTITGDTNVHIVNGIHLPNLDDSILKVDGDQIITGKHEFKNIVTGAVSSPRIILQSQHSLDELLTQNIDQALGDAFIGQLSIDSLKANNVEVLEQFNGIDVNAMLKDTLFRGQNAKVAGSKHFENLTINTLLSRKSINMNRIPTLIKRGEAVTGSESSLKLPDDIVIENIKFGRFLNNMSAESFENNWLNGKPQQTIAGDQVFDKVVVFGRLQVDTNQINKLNLKHLLEDTVKSTEDFQFEQVTFVAAVTSLAKIDLLGHVENLDLDAIVADGGEEIRADSLTFKDTVTTFAPAYLRATINGFNFSDLCAYSVPSDDETRKSLVLLNGATVIKPPIVNNVNGKNLKLLEATVWFNDQPTNLTDLRAETITFVEDVVVDGYVADTNLKWLEDNYFSKTSNQTVTADIHFQQGLTVDGNLNAPKANIKSINELDLEEFVRTALLQGWDQTFEEALFAEALTFNDLQGDYRINGLNLQTDVMRYDAENIVTGKVTVEDVDVEVLKTERDFKVQNVDLKDWTKNAVLKSGSYQINGRVLFENDTVFEKGVGLTGLLNRKSFTGDEVLLRSRAQTITGRKVFVGSLGNVPEFKDVKLKGLLNGVVFSDLIHNQALKNTDNVFTTSVDFHSSVSAQNVNFEGLYRGVNVTQLLDNLTTNAFVENYYDNYDKLRDASRAVKKSLHNQANYLNYFRTIQNFQTLLDVIPMRSIKGELHLATLREANHTHIIDFFKWIPHPGVFTIDSAMKEIKFHDPITNWAPLEYKFETYLYLEYEAHDALGNTRIGHVLRSQNKSSYEIIAAIPSNGTRRVLPLFLPNVQKSCVLLVHAISNYMDIWCQGEHTMELHQRLPIVNALQVEVADYPNRLEIHAIEKNIDEVKYRYERGAGHSKLKHEKYPAVVIWTYDEHTELFNEQQRIFTSTPISISGAKHNRNEYLAVASGHLVNTMYSGQVDIKKYDPIRKQYTDWQVFRASAPLQVHLSVLPSNELLLYVLKNSPTDMLIVYQYTGIGKFAPLGTISSLQFCNSIHPVNFVQDNEVLNLHEHFIIAKCNGAVEIIQSVFKA